MEIEKLAQLSCLNVKESEKNKVQLSIDSIIKMMKEIQNINENNLNQEKTVKEIDLRRDILSEELLVNKDDCKSLHLEDGLFLAPKTVKK